ncbi:MAG: methyltransferase domain-containing protein [FCB group bacterium]|nr:methyltransferase domain-containing protein [FCB group bacterium]
MAKQRPETTVEFWDQRYQQNTIPWDLNAPNPVFVRLSKELKPGTLAIFGAGRGHEAIEFARQGFSVMAIDFAPRAIQYITQQAKQYNQTIETYLGDIFQLPKKFSGRFDYILEQTCYCAIDPNNRPAYEESAWDLLRPGGELFGLWFPLHKPREAGGPPWGVEVESVKTQFKRWKILDAGFPPDSSPDRREKEYYFRFQKPGM